GERAAGLNRESTLILADGVVETALLGEILAAGDGGAGAEGSAALEDEVIGIDPDTAGLGAAKGFDGKAGFRADDVYGLQFRIAFGINAQLHGHAKGVQGLLNLAVDA